MDWLIRFLSPADAWEGIRRGWDQYFSRLGGVALSAAVAIALDYPVVGQQIATAIAEGLLPASLLADMNADQREWAGKAMGAGAVWLAFLAWGLLAAPYHQRDKARVAAYGPMSPREVARALKETGLSYGDLSVRDMFLRAFQRITRPHFFANDLAQHVLWQEYKPSRASVAFIERLLAAKVLRLPERPMIAAPAVDDYAHGDLYAVEWTESARRAALLWVKQETAVVRRHFIRLLKTKVMWSGEERTAAAVAYAIHDSLSCILVQQDPGPDRIERAGKTSVMLLTLENARYKWSAPALTLEEIRAAALVLQREKYLTLLDFHDGEFGLKENPVYGKRLYSEIHEKIKGELGWPATPLYPT